MKPIHCGACGHFLSHIDEACPVCLPNFYTRASFKPEDLDPEKVDEQRDLHNKLRGAVIALRAVEQYKSQDVAESVIGEEIDKLLNLCPNCECSVCSVIVCPHGDKMHLHHDGCPSC